jgi:hypothetical protein
MARACAGTCGCGRSAGRSLVATVTKVLPRHARFHWPRTPVQVRFVSGVAMRCKSTARWFSIRSSNAALRRTIHAGIGLSCSATAIVVLQGLAQKMDCLSPARASSLRIPVNGSVYGKERQCVVPPSMQMCEDFARVVGCVGHRRRLIESRIRRGNPECATGFSTTFAILLGLFAAAPHPQRQGRPVTS